MRAPVIWVSPAPTAPDPMLLVYTHPVHSIGTATQKSPISYHQTTSPPTVSHLFENQPSPVSTSPSHSTSPAPASVKSSSPQQALVPIPFPVPSCPQFSHLYPSGRYPSPVYPTYRTTWLVLHLPIAQSTSTTEQRNRERSLTELSPPADLATQTPP